jgi:hypothetical protein
MALENMEEYSNRLLRLEERFNREMEASRRRDLTEKEALKTRQRTARIEHMEEFVRASAAKASALVELFRQREVEQENEFRRILEAERRKWRAVIRDKDEEIFELTRQLNATVGIQTKPEVQILREQVVREVEVPTKPEIPYFGIEVEDPPTVSEPGVRVVSVTSPSGNAGLMAGDLIHQIIIPVQIRSQEDFLRALGKTCPLQHPYTTR